MSCSNNCDVSNANLDEFSSDRINISDEKGPRAISVISVEKDRDVDVDDVAVGLGSILPNRIRSSINDVTAMGNGSSIL